MSFDTLRRLAAGADAALDPGATLDLVLCQRLPATEVDALRSERDRLTAAGAPTKPLMQLALEQGRIDTVDLEATVIDVSRRLRRGGRLGAYEVLGPLGEGGMGRVVRARDEAGRHVAIKVLHTPQSETLANRIRREAELLGRLDHPNVVRVLALGHDPVAGLPRGLPYLVMELIAGPSLSEFAPTRPLAERLRLLACIADAVAHAHAAGVVHRDLKPSNVLLAAPDRPVLVDFGLAWSATEVTRLTTPGSVMGTLPYMAPEQIRGERGSPATDVWALGAMLHELLTGSVPFPARGPGQISARIQTQPPLAGGDAGDGLPPALRALCLRALSKAPEDRPRDGAAFAAGLRAALGPPARVGRTRRRRPLLIVLLLASAVGAGLWWDRRRDARDGPPPVPPAPPPTLPVPESLGPWPARFAAALGASFELRRPEQSASRRAAIARLEALAREAQRALPGRPEPLAWRAAALRLRLDEAGAREVAEEALTLGRPCPRARYELLLIALESAWLADRGLVWRTGTAAETPARVAVRDLLPWLPRPETYDRLRARLHAGLHGLGPGEPDAERSRVIEALRSWCTGQRRASALAATPGTLHGAVAADVALLRATLSLAEGKAQEAFEVLEASVRADPGRAGHRERLARLTLAAIASPGRPAQRAARLGRQAQARLRSVLQTATQRRPARLALALVPLALALREPASAAAPAQCDAAIQALEELLVDDPTDALSWQYGAAALLRRAELARHQGDRDRRWLDRADRQLTQAIGLADPSAGLHGARAVVRSLIVSGDALRDVDAALAADARLAHLHLWRAALLPPARRDERLTSARRAAALAPSWPAALRALAGQLISAGQHAAALPVARRAHSLAPESAEAAYQLAQAQAAAGQKTTARTTARTARRLARSPELAARIDQLLRALDR